MRITFAGLVLLIGVSAAGTASPEILYPWCKLSTDGGTNCGFTSREQCQGGSSRGGFCVENPAYRGEGSTPYDTVRSGKTPRNKK